MARVAERKKSAARQRWAQFRLKEAMEKEGKDGGAAVAEELAAEARRAQRRATAAAAAAAEAMAAAAEAEAIADRSSDLDSEEEAELFEAAEAASDACARTRRASMRVNEKDAVRPPSAMTAGPQPEAATKTKQHGWRNVFISPHASAARRREQRIKDAYSSSEEGSSSSL